jgi:HEAT repeat protein
MIPDISDKDGHSLRMLLHVAIKQFPPEVAYDFLLDKDRLVGAMAALRLQMEPSLGERTFNYAVELSGHKNAWHRELAAFILGQLCPPDYPFKSRAVPVLESLVRDSEPAVRGAAIVALGHLESKASKELVLAALNDPDAGVVGCASFALWAIGKTKADEDKLRAAVNRFDEKTRKTIDLWDDD